MKNNIKSLREKNNLTQKDCADIFGVTLRAWQTYEQGVSEPKYEMLCKIADYFDVTLDYLLGREPPEQETISRLAGEFNMSALEKKILEGYLDLPKNVRGDFMEFLHKAVLEVKEESAPDYGPMRHSATLEELRADDNAEKDA